MEAFISFPNYNTTVRASCVTLSGKYTTLYDVINHLYSLGFLNHHIRGVYTTIRESPYLLNSLQSIRGVVIQMEPECCGRYSAHVLENSGRMWLSERVMYIRMHDYSNGCRVAPSVYQNALLWVVMGAFAILGIAISLVRMAELLNPAMGKSTAP